MANPQLKEYYSQVNSLNQTIESKLNLIENTKSPKEGNSLVSETNQLISSSSLILAKVYEVDNSNIALMKENYSKLESYRKTLSTLSTRIQLQLLTSIEDKEHQQSQMKTDQPIDLNFNTDYNESLLHGAVSNLNNIHHNLSETSANLKGQGEKIGNTLTVMEKGNNNIDNNASQLNAMTCTSKCQKLWMIIVNVLLFSVILLLIMLKVLNYLK